MRRLIVLMGILASIRKQDRYAIPYVLPKWTRAYLRYFRQVPNAIEGLCFGCLVLIVFVVSLLHVYVCTIYH